MTTHDLAVAAGCGSDMRQNHELEDWILRRTDLRLKRVLEPSGYRKYDRVEKVREYRVSEGPRGRRGGNRISQVWNPLAALLYRILQTQLIH